MVAGSLGKATAPARSSGHLWVAPVFAGRKTARLLPADRSHGRPLGEGPGKGHHVPADVPRGAEPPPGLDTGRKAHRILERKPGRVRPVYAAFGWRGRGAQADRKPNPSDSDLDLA